MLSRPARAAGSNRLRQGYGGPPKLHAKAEEQDPAYVVKLPRTTNHEHSYGLKNVSRRPADITPIHAQIDMAPAIRALVGGAAWGSCVCSRLNVRA